MSRSMLFPVIVSAVSLGAPIAVADPASSRQPLSAAAINPVAAPLDLRLGDIRRFVPAEELGTPLDAAVDEVVVRSSRVRARLPERMPIPRGVGGLGWLLEHPTQFWRLFVPDPNRPIVEPQETPGAHRMRIGEPARIFR